MKIDHLFLTFAFHIKENNQNMKKSIALAALVAVSSVFITGCSKDDSEAPIITLIGDNPLVLGLTEVYTENGATADDNEDGNISSSIIVDASDINNILPNTYFVYYSVSDAAGNLGEATREVKANTISYAVKDTCSSGGPDVVYNYNQEVSSTNGTTLSFNKFGDYSNNTGITATINSNNTITLATQNGLGIGASLENHEFSGSGNTTAGGFMITYIDKNNSAVPVAIATCRAWFARN